MPKLLLFFFLLILTSPSVDASEIIPSPDKQKKMETEVMEKISVYTDIKKSELKAEGDAQSKKVKEEGDENVEKIEKATENLERMINLVIAFCGLILAVLGIKFLIPVLSNQTAKARNSSREVTNRDENKEITINPENNLNSSQDSIFFTMSLKIAELELKLKKRNKRTITAGKRYYKKSLKKEKMIAALLDEIENLKSEFKKSLIELEAKYTSMAIKVELLNDQQVPNTIQYSSDEIHPHFFDYQEEWAYLSQKCIDYLKLADVAFNTRRYEDAIRAYEEVFKENLSNITGMYAAHIAYQYANALKNCGRKEKAIEYYCYSVKRDKTNPIVYKELGEVYHSEGEIQKAISSYEHSVRLHGDAGLHNLIGKLLWEKSLRIQARQKFFDAVTVDQKFYEGYVNIIIACLFIKDYSNAKENFDHLVEKSSGEMQYYFHRQFFEIIIQCWTKTYHCELDRAMAHMRPAIAEANGYIAFNFDEILQAIREDTETWGTKGFLEFFITELRESISA